MRVLAIALCDLISSECKLRHLHIFPLGLHAPMLLRETKRHGGFVCVHTSGPLQYSLLLTPLANDQLVVVHMVTCPTGWAATSLAVCIHVV